MLSDGTLIDTLNKGDVYGQEILFLHKHVRAIDSTVIAQMECSCYVIDKEAYANLLKIQSKVVARSKYTQNAEATRKTVAELSKAPLITKMQLPYKIALAKELESRRYDRGQTIVEEGEFGDEMFIIRQGSVSVEVQGEVVGGPCICACVYVCVYVHACICVCVCV